MTLEHANISRMESSEGSMPQWARSTFKDFLDHTKTLGEVLHLTMGGISMVRPLPKPFAHCTFPARRNTPRSPCLLRRKLKLLKPSITRDLLNGKLNRTSISSILNP